MKISDQLGRHLQDRGVDLAKLTEFENTDAGKAAAEHPLEKIQLPPTADSSGVSGSFFWGGARKSVGGRR